MLPCLPQLPCPGRAGNIGWLPQGLQDIFLPKFLHLLKILSIACPAHPACTVAGNLVSTEPGEALGQHPALSPAQGRDLCLSGRRTEETGGICSTRVLQAWELECMHACVPGSVDEVTSCQAVGGQTCGEEQWGTGTCCCRSAGSSAGGLLGLGPPAAGGAVAVAGGRVLGGLQRMLHALASL